MKKMRGFCGKLQPCRLACVAKMSTVVCFPALDLQSGQVSRTIGKLKSSEKHSTCDYIPLV